MLIPTAPAARTHGPAAARCPAALRGREDRNENQGEDADSAARSPGSSDIQRE